MPSALLISDLHLPAGPSEYREALLHLLQGPAREAQAVYLLGDIFEYWLGDDVSLEDHRPIFEALRLLRAQGVRLFFLHGNRDFLVGKSALAAGGLQALPDPCVVQLPDGPALLSHGDIWCTQDIAYQRWRRFAHNRMAQRAFTALPAPLRRHIARRLRAQSRAHGDAARQALLDVHPAAVRAAFRHYRVRRIIHGHTHRPAHHDTPEGQRIVLPDWRPGQMCFLFADRRGSAVCPVP